MGSTRHTSAPPTGEATPPASGGPLPADRLDDLTAGDLMTPGVVSIVDDASLRNGFRAMAAHGTHAILVLGARTGAPLGWITDRGLLGHLESEGSLKPVSSAITEEAMIVTLGTTARRCATRLSGGRTTHLLVAAAVGRQPQGVVSALDLVRAAAP